MIATNCESFLDSFIQQNELLSIFHAQVQPIAWIESERQIFAFKFQIICKDHRDKQLKYHRENKKKRVHESRRIIREIRLKFKRKLKLYGQWLCFTYAWHIEERCWYNDVT